MKNIMILLSIIIAIAIVIVGYFVFEFNFKDIFITAIISSFVSLLVYFLNKKERKKSDTQQRYNNAISQIKSKREGVVRIGFKNLYELALEEQSDDTRKRICTVFCNYLQTESHVDKADISKDTVQFILDLLIEKKNGKEIPFLSKWLDLSNVNFQGADLNNTNLQGAQLQGANLSGVQLEEADLKGVILDNAILQRTNFKDAKNLKVDQFYQIKDLNLEGACLAGLKLNGGNFSNFILKGADLSNTQLQGAFLSGAQLQGADLSDAQLQNAHLYSAKLQGAKYLGYANFEGADLSGAHLQGAFFHRDSGGVQLQGANLSGAYLQGAFLSKAQLQGANLEKAQLQGANLNHANLEGATFKGTDFRGVYTEWYSPTYENPELVLKYAIRKLKEKSKLGQPTDLKNVIFDKGVNVNSLSKSGDIITGIYPKADADKVIEDLEKINDELAALKKTN